jgi:2'-phosphotransferase
MTRNHIHFAPGFPKEEGVISGFRGSCDVIIQIDMASAMKEGIEFFISSNNVILTEGIDGVLPPKFFLKVLRKDLTVIEEKLEKVEKEEKVVAEEPV